jgi:hypothetical protein
MTFPLQALLFRCSASIFSHYATEKARQAMRAGMLKTGRSGSDKATRPLASPLTLRLLVLC